MSLSAAVLDALLAHGASAEMIVAAVKADNAAAEQRAAEKREKDATRQRKSRVGRGLSRDVTVTPCDDKDAKAVPPNDIYSNPPESHSAKAELPLFEKRLLEVWNEASAKHGLTAAKALDAGRKSKLRARIRDHGEQSILDAIGNLAASKFHCGENDRSWKASIGWFLTAENFLKACELAPAKPAPSKLSGDELAEHRARLAEHYERTGKTVEAAEIRRASVGPPRHIGNIAANILNRTEQAA